ncbi:Initiation-specific alpha-1,6-mannosyltransferase [Neolecta irregularis DAH-3]|uniref:Initiation-specific alpha-1,6-mannosyltransferase n=1 Tax=Neolecta irregularis (strain DAH-3) TaxID=1198029 RepID=A0A1U7LGJ7_NEOID|nr:Initiation-specific alpha-1,6-mannosyltransferase [Neolecta irregularis DAH-3]|eukprot:OLL21672.1 Initiation-specific alpha-1,6-mannosyltransferase [Neolecta irregularis DAH-3]
MGRGTTPGGRQSTNITRGGYVPSYAENEPIGVDWNNFKGNLRDRLRKAIPYSPSEPWTKRISQTWREPDIISDDKYLSWDNIMPDFEHLFLSDEQVDIFVERFCLDNNLPEINNAYFDILSVRRIFKADFVRYLLIYIRGGIWADIDTTAKKHFNDWLAPANGTDVGFITGMEMDWNEKGSNLEDKKHGDWNENNHRRCLTQYIFAAKAGHPALLEMIARLVDSAVTIRHHAQFNKNINVGHMTGPDFMTSVLIEWVHKRFHPTFDVKDELHNQDEPIIFGDLMIYPIWAFGAGQRHSNSPPLSDPRILAVHHFQATPLN